MCNTDVIKVDARRKSRTYAVDGDGDIRISLTQPIRQICFQRIRREKIIEKKSRDTDDVGSV